jgi:hypothetical protein
VRTVNPVFVSPGGGLGEDISLQCEQSRPQKRRVRLLLPPR